jgi:hypothetical protein
MFLCAACWRDTILKMSLASTKGWGTLLAGFEPAGMIAEFGRQCVDVVAWE